MAAGRTTSVEVPSTGTYRVDPDRSTVSYSGRHLFGLGVVHATFTISSGELTVADPPTASTAVVTVDAGSFHSNSVRRDKDVRAASLLDVASYPEITFASDGLRPDGDGWRMTGSVTAHGRTVATEVLVDQVTPASGGVRLHARAEHLDRYAFGITKSKGMVGRYLDLDLDVFAVPA